MALFSRTKDTWLRQACEAQGVFEREDDTLPPMLVAQAEELAQRSCQAFAAYVYSVHAHACNTQHNDSLSLSLSLSLCVCVCLWGGAGNAVASVWSRIDSLIDMTTDPDLWAAVVVKGFNSYWCEIHHAIMSCLSTSICMYPSHDHVLFIHIIGSYWCEPTTRLHLSP